MKKWLYENRQLAVRTTGTVLAIALLVLLLYGQKWTEIIDSVRQTPPIAFVIAVAAMILSRIFIVTRWYILMRSGGVKIAYRRAAALTFTGLFATNFLPTTVDGDVVRLAGAMQMGFDRVTCLAAIAADRLIGLGGAVFALPSGLFLLWQWSSHTPAAAAISLAGLRERAATFLRRFFQSFSIWARQPGALLLSLLCTWGHMLCVFVMTSVLLGGMGEHVPFWTIAGLWSITYFVTLIPVSINGYGIQELSTTYLYSLIGGISLSHSLAVAVLTRLMFMFASLPGSIFLPSVLDESLKLKQAGLTHRE